MLTNNKNFVRSIAMLLAVLMVMALCLTGCGNKAADEALTKAEEAKTAADAVTAALDGYVAKDDKATVKALVIEALGDDYATAAELEALAAKLADYVTAENVEKMIKDEMAKYALDKLSGELMTKEDVLEILKDYYTKDEIDEKFANVLGEFTAEEVQAILKDAMALTEWDDTSDVVLKTIENMQTLIDSLEGKTYTQANMAKVNEILADFGITVFEWDKDAELYVALKGSDVDRTVGKLLEYAILRQATLADMAKLEAVVEAAVAVPTFESSFAALKADLFALGDLYTVGNYVTATRFEAAKYTTDNNFYHEAPVAKGAEKQVQIVTLADKAGYHAFIKAYDALLAEYNADRIAYEAEFGAGSAATTAEGWIESDAYDLYAVSTLSGVVLQILPAGDDNVPANSTLLGQTIQADTAVDGFLRNAYLGELEANEILVYPSLSIATTGLAKDDVTTAYKTTKTFESFYNDLGVNHEKGNDVWKTVYALVYNQLDDIQALADAANLAFGGFLKDTIHARTLGLSTKVYETVTDAELLNALTKDMCELVSVPYPSYLLTDVEPTVVPFMVANGQSYDSAFGGLLRSDLYDSMLAKSFDLLWQTYQNQAIEWAKAILQDYISVTYEAAANAAGKDDPATTNADERNVLLVSPSGATLTEGEATTDFLTAFVDGTADLTGTMYGKLGLADKFKASNLNMFYTNNAKATTSLIAANMKLADYNNNAKTSAKIYAVPMYTIATQGNNIRARLASAMTYTNMEIARADLATYKANGGSVKTAFYGLLTDAIENMDEIYARFLFEDYKKMTYNNTVADAAEIITFYYGSANANAVKRMEQYLMGVQTIGSLTTANAVDGINVEWNYDKNGNMTTVKAVSFKANSMQNTLTNGTLLTKVTPIKADLWAQSNMTGTEKNAAAKMAEVDAIVAEVIATIENVVIKQNFKAYLNTARMALGQGLLDYVNEVDTINATDYATDLKFSEVYNMAIDQTQYVEFYHDLDKYALESYKDAYVGILELVIERSNDHLILLSGLSIADIIDLPTAYYTYYENLVDETMLEAIKSSEALNWVVGKYSPYTNAADYKYLGSYAVDLDKIINTMAGRATTYRNDNNVIVPLY